MLTVGSKTDVKELQKLLNDCGYPCKIDGDYGPKTRALVIAVQKSFGLKPDGVFTPLLQRGLAMWAPHKALGGLVSAHFKDSEFVCHDDSGLVRIHPRLPAMLEKLRAYFNAPVHSNSGFRTPSYNARIGGAKNSYHVKGMAADVVIVGHSPEEVARAARELGFGGVGLYRNFTHVDVGPVRSWVGE